ncbi:hypothetical protein GTY65_32875 [Streptomyces sp. SID8379]|uniref:hypothetical protein n=1 Tax=unclassified Streptomyces TaxID=2593676 RepID=UPI00036293FD|nr:MULTISPECIES: hypothetical protein [unclassified Streptomyces]MYW68834.1 hypothetical protein [Streptomyces sp. SID8379]
MAQHAAPGTGTAFSPTSAAVWIPVWTGVLYGFWAANIQRYGHGVTGGNIALGLVTGILVAALCFGIHQWSKQQAGRHFGLRAATWAVFAGIAVGFLNSLSNASHVWSSLLGLGVAAGTFVATYYRYYTANEPV